MPGSFDMGQAIHLSSDRLLTECPDPVGFDSQDCDAGAEYGPVIVVQGFGNMVEEKEDRQISHVTEAAAVFDTGHHAAKAQNDGEKDVDQQNGAYHCRGGRLTEMGGECSRRR